MRTSLYIGRDDDVKDARAATYLEHAHQLVAGNGVGAIDVVEVKRPLELLLQAAFQLDAEIHEKLSEI